MKPNKVLIVFKKSTWQLQAHEYKEPHFLKLIEEGHASVAKVKSAHDQHVETLAAIQNELEKCGIKYDSCHRAELDEKVRSCDLVITVGGDGTFLDASHSLKKTPIFGVNSAPGSSFGHFCVANRETFAERFEQLLSGERKPERMLRLELAVNGKKLHESVLNEVLIAHSNPAGTSRYLIKIGDQEEEQRSSGIWVGPPAGSTGAIKSSGGAILNITDDCYQYVVREAWTRPGQHFQFMKGILPRTQTIRIISQMRTGALYIDGQHIEYPFPLGDELQLKAADDDLIAFVDPKVNDIFLND